MPRALSKAVKEALSSFIRSRINYNTRKIILDMKPWSLKKRYLFLTVHCTVDTVKYSHFFGLLNAGNASLTSKLDPTHLISVCRYKVCNTAIQIHKYILFSFFFTFMRYGNGSAIVNVCVCHSSFFFSLSRSPSFPVLHSPSSRLSYSL